MTDETNTILDDATRAIWDVIVIGAGPAGAVAARQAALGGLRTLLLEAKPFPREKVCGGYLNPRALDVLRYIGLGHLMGGCPERDVSQLEMIRGNQRTRFDLPHGRIICRSTFDAALVESARIAGATISTGTPATVESGNNDAYRSISASCEGARHNLKSRFVICADGLSRSSVRHISEFASITDVNSRVGIGAVLVGDIDICPVGQITMTVARHGYVGISHINFQQFNVAATVDRELLSHASPREVVSALLRESGIVMPADARNSNWRGTPFLTSRPKRVASDRIILIGDAAGYVEPFTGEGMAAAFEAAVAATPLAIQAAKSWTSSIADRWEMLHWQLVRERQRTCRQLAWILRRPWASFAAINFCRMAPGVANRLIAKTSDPIPDRMAIETNST